MVDLMLSSEAAAVLHCTPANVRKLEGLGKLKAARTATGTRLFRRADVERLAREREQARKGR